ncbi:MAG TPA: cupin domain-containing protein [Acidimicrobiales bacterium]
MTPSTIVETHVDRAERHDAGNGIVVHRLFRSGPGPGVRRTLLVRFPPGSRWPGVDVHEPGPEEVYVVSGTFRGLTGDTSVHGPGTFLHLPAGSSHSPSTDTGGDLLVHYPEG